MSDETTPDRLALEREGVRLALLDFGGGGNPALLLHGLAGHSGEWSATAAWLHRDRRVLALDIRGHGHSEREPLEVAPEALAADVAFVIERLELGRVLLIGQSLGGHLALRVASRRPELVETLVVAEAGPAGAGLVGATRQAAELEDSLTAWPTPFPSRDAAEAFFGGPTSHAAAWASGLELRGDGWYPRFEVKALARMLCENVADDYWGDWSRIQCPTLVVRGAAGTLSPADAQRMVANGQHVQLIELDAGHELHLEQPEAWEQAVRGFSPSHRPCWSKARKATPRNSNPAE
jgi:pimeloyl-ACP methyl ester carboxylesterase